MNCLHISIIFITCVNKFFILGFKNGVCRLRRETDASETVQFGQHSMRQVVKPHRRHRNAYGKFHRRSQRG
jgi:hypothetical protein